MRELLLCELLLRKLVVAHLAIGLARLVLGEPLRREPLHLAALAVALLGRAAVGIAPSLLECWREGSPDFDQRLEATLQTIRHRAVVLIQAADERKALR